MCGIGYLGKFVTKGLWLGGESVKSAMSVIASAKQNVRFALAIRTEVNDFGWHRLRNLEKNVD